MHAHVSEVAEKIQDTRISQILTDVCCTQQTGCPVGYCPFLVLTRPPHLKTGGFPLQSTVTRRCLHHTHRLLHEMSTGRTEL